MSFNINGVPIVENVGTLGLFSGVTDPSGWLICDGSARDNTTGVYNNLYKQATGKNYGYGPAWTNYGISQTINTVTGSITLSDVRGVAISDVGTVVLADRASTGLYISQNNGTTYSALPVSGTTSAGPYSPNTSSSNIPNSATVSPYSNTWTASGLTWTATGSNWNTTATYLPSTAFALSGSYRGFCPGSKYSGTSPFAYVTSNGASTTIGGGIGPVLGEWLQLQASTSLNMTTFQLASEKTYTSFYTGSPSIFYIVGSNTGTGTWDPIMYCTLNTSAFSSTSNSYYIALGSNVTTTAVFSVPSGTVTGAVNGNMTYTTYGNGSNNYQYYRIVTTNLIGNGSFLVFNVSINFNINTPFGNCPISCVDISQDGTKIVAAANVIGQGLFLSTNTGSTWSQLYTANGLPMDLISMDNGSNKVAISNDGTKIAVAYTNGFVYYSSNSGATFKAVSPFGSTGSGSTTSIPKNYWGLGMSKDGNKLVTAVNNGSLVPNYSNLSSLFVTSPGTGLAATTQYGHSSMSYNGQYQAISVGPFSGPGAGVYVSANYGTTWTFTAGFCTGGGVGPSLTAMSATGQYIYGMVGGYTGTFCYSSNYGVHWINTATTLGGHGCRQISCSATGQYVLAPIDANGGQPCLLSSTYGTSFYNISTSSVPAARYGGGGISSTGQYMHITNGNYFSSNYGINWTATATPSAGGRAYASGSGQYFLIVPWSSSVPCVSSNYGISFFTPSAASTGDSYGGISYTGQYMVSNNQYSSNYGVNWTTITNMVNPCISANGQYVLAITESGAGSVKLAKLPYWAPGQNNVTKYWTTKTALPTNGNYSGVSLSYTGQYQSACSLSGYLYISSDFGNSWKIPSTLSSTSSYMATSISKNGQYIVASSSSFAGVYLSTSFGNSFTAVTISGMSAAQGCCISQSGKYIIVGTNGKSIYLSSSFGSNWIPSANISGLTATLNINFPSISENGDYILIVNWTPGTVWLSSNSGNSFYSIPFFVTAAKIAGSGTAVSNTGQYMIVNFFDFDSGYSYLSTSYGINWNTIQTTISAAYASISENGQFMILSAGGSNSTFAGNAGSGAVYYSTNYGSSFINDGLPRGIGYFSAAISGNAQYALVGAYPGSVYSSTYKDQPWLQQNQIGQNVVTNPGTGLPATAAYWNSSISYSGQYLLAAQSSSVYLSSNYGNNWRALLGVGGFPGTISGWGCSMSATGQFMAVPNKGGALYLSSDYGINWTATQGAYATLQSTESFVSTTGQYIIITDNNTGASLSSSYGKFWTSNLPGFTGTIAYNYGCATSSTGQYMLIGNTGISTNRLFLSTNFGSNWSVKLDSTPAINGVAISSSGQYMIASNYNTGASVYISSNYGSFWSTSPSGLPTGNWISCWVSQTGQYMATCDYTTSGKVYMSNNFGVTWYLNSNFPINKEYRSIRMSQNGAYLIVVVQGGAVYLSAIPNVDGGIAYSTDSGNNWAAGGQLGGPYYNSVAISGDGSTMLAGYQNDSPYVSTGTSNTFNYTSIPPVTGTNTSGLALSSTGQNAIITQQGGQGTGQIFTSTSFGSNFTNSLLSGQTISDNFYGAASVSQSGSVMVAGAGGLVYSTATASNNGQIVFSTGSGSTYNANNQNFSTLYGTSYFIYSGSLSTTQNWNVASISSNGQYMLAASNNSGGGYLYLSTNTGGFWSAPLGVTSTYQLAWNGCAVSPSTNALGYYVMAATVNNGSVYLSTNTGVNWTTSTLALSAWSSISMDADGNTIAVIASGSQIYVSTNTGTTWQAYGSALAYTDIAVSLTGQYMAATVLGGQIYVSSNTGTSWTAYATSQSWLDIHMSGNASTMVAAANNGPIYISTNTGQAWTPLVTTNNVLPTSATWANVGISSDGTQIVATISGGLIYTSTNSGAFWSNVQSTVTGQSATTSWSNCLAMSGNGSTIVAGQSIIGGTGALYVSINTVYIKQITTSTWSANNIPLSINIQTGSVTLVDVRGVAVSDVGTVVLSDRTKTGLYISQNNWASWAPISSASLPAISFSCVDISADGTKIVAAANVVGQGLFLSTNTGSTWTQLYTANGLPTDLISMDNGSNKVAISNDGTKIAVAYTNGFVYYSSNSGATFKIVSPAGPTGTSLLGQNVAKNYWGLGMSKDGSKLVTAVNNGSFIPDFTKISFVTNPGTGLPASNTYKKTALSATGQYALAVVANVSVYLSNNYGQTWSIPTPLSSSIEWFGASISATGQYMIVALRSPNGSIYLSTNYGINWSTSAGNSVTHLYTGASISSSGQYMATISNDGPVTFSSSYGVFWKDTPGTGLPLVFGNASYIAISSTGQYIITSQSNNQSPYRSTDFGVNWLIVGIGGIGSGGQNDVAISGSGQYMVVGSTGSSYVSSSYGSSFKTFAWSASQSSVSYTGQIIIMGSYISTNYGVNFTIASYISTAVAMSADGQYILTGGTTLNLASLPYWAPGKNNLTKYWTTGSISGGGCAISANGQYMLTDSKYISNDYGTTFNSITDTNLSSLLNRWNCAMSYSGQYMIIGCVVNTSKPYISTNYGINWNTNSTFQTNAYRMVAVSGNGQYMLSGTTVSSGTTIYMSSNFGNNWITNPGGVAATVQCSVGGISYDGQYMFVAGNLSTNYGVNWTLNTNLNGTDNGSSGNMSGNGQVIFFSGHGWTTNYLKISTDYGKTFFTNSFAISGYNTMGISYTGQYLFSWGYLSTNYGVNWTLNSNVNPGGNTNTVNGAAMSADGNYILNVTTSGYFLSTYKDQAWLQQNQSIITTPGAGLLATAAYSSSSISLTGQYILTAVISGSVYLSSNYGVNWTANPGTGLPATADYRGCSLSGDGKYMVLAAYGSPLYLSSNFGVNWISNPPGFTTQGGLRGCYVSQTGQFILVTAAYVGGGATLSTSYGQYWKFSPGGLVSGQYTYGCAISETGQYMLVGMEDNYYYLTTNSGNNWTQFGVTGSYYGVGINATGQFMLACKDGAYIYISSNHGSSWRYGASTGLPTGSWKSCSLSATGQYMVAANASSYIYMSSNYGISWYLNTNFPINKTYSSVSISQDGSYILAVANGGAVYLSITNTANMYLYGGQANVDGGISYSSDSGNNWTAARQIGGPFFNSAAISGDGSTMLAGYQNDSPNVSTGFSNTFNQTTTVIPFGKTYSLALSSTGQNAIITQQSGQGMGQIFTSTSFGSNFTSGLVSSAAISDNFYGAASISQNGQVAIAGAGGLVYTTTTANTSGQIAFSTGSGSTYNTNIQNFSTQTGTFYNTFASQSITSQSWSSVSISLTGQVMAATSSNLAGGYLYLSTNTGTNWSIATTLSSYTLNFSSVALSQTGQYALASVTAGNLYVSANASNTGTTWSTISNAQAWTDVALSSTGQTMVAVGTGIQPYVSVNSGSTWSSYGTAQNYSAVTTSATGQYMAATVTAGQIYLSSSTGANWTVLSNSTTANWSSISMSSSGQSIIAASSAALYLSTSFGQSWSAISNINSVGSLSSVSISNNGTCVIASTNTGYIYASVNSATTWTVSTTTADTPRAWQAVSLSGDGSKALAITNPGQVYTSTDGQTLDFKPITMPTVTTLDGVTLRYITKY